MVPLTWSRWAVTRPRRTSSSPMFGSAIGRNVADDQHAGARRRALDQPKRRPWVPVAEQPLATADHQRMDHQRVHVHQIMLHQRLDQLAAADDPQILAILPFQ